MLSLEVCLSPSRLHLLKIHSIGVFKHACKCACAHIPENLKRVRGSLVATILKQTVCRLDTCKERKESVPALRA